MSLHHYKLYATNFNFFPVYVDVANNGCIDLTFQFGTIPMGAPAVNRMWSIKVEGSLDLSIAH